MPQFIFRAVTDKGLIVKNKIEEGNKQTVIKKLKKNGLIPISVVQVSYLGGNNKKKRRNMANTEDIMKTASTTNILNNNAKRKLTTVEKLNLKLRETEKITSRDLVIFTQNFYLLKKANFNNIHALSTIIESTENLSLVGILEDILAGVEAGEYMYTTMEYYSNVFPYIYVNMIKVGELSGSLTKSLEQAVKYLDKTNDITKKVKKIVLPNIAMFVAIVIMMIVGTLVSVPAIENVYKSVGSTDTLPAITLAFNAFIHWVLEYWIFPVGIIAAIIGSVLFYVNTPRGKYNFHYFKYKMPIFGKLIYSLDFSRFIKAMLGMKIY